MACGNNNTGSKMSYSKTFKETMGHMHILDAA